MTHKLILPLLPTILAAFAAASTLAAAPQEPAPASASAAKALLDAATAAIAKTGPVRYRVRSSTTAGDYQVTLQAEVALGRPHGRSGMPFVRPITARMTSKTTGPVEANGAAEPATFFASFDGVRLLHQMPEEKSVWEIRFAEGDGFPVLPLWDAGLPGFSNERLVVWDDAKLALGEPRSIDGHACKVLVVTARFEREAAATGSPSPVMVMQRTIAFDAKSMLPRLEEMRSENHVGDTVQPVLVRRIELLGDIEPLSGEPADFSVPVPDGWKAVDATPKRLAPKLTIGAEAPDWKLADPNGVEHSLRDLRGKVVLLDFWATWCGPCKQAMPHLQELHVKFGDQGLAVIGISIRENEDGDPAGYFASKQYTYLCLLRGEQPAKDYGVGGIPHIFLIDKAGKVAFQTVGMGPKGVEQLAAKVAELLRD